MKIRLIENNLRNKIRQNNFTAWHDYLPSFKHQGSLVMVYKELLWPGAKYQTKHSNEYTIVQCSFSGTKLLKNSYWEATVNKESPVIHRLYPDIPVESINSEEVAPYFGYQFWFNSLTTDKDSTVLQLDLENKSIGHMISIYESGGNDNSYVSLKYGVFYDGQFEKYVTKDKNSKVYLHLVSGVAEVIVQESITIMNSEDSMEISQIDQFQLKFLRNTRFFIVENYHQ